MDADFSIELGREDPVLDFPWHDPEGKLRYFDLKRQPELISQVAEAREFPELGEFLRTVNSGRSILESVKCDAWATTELNAEEEVFGASHKLASYVDLIFSDAVSNPDCRLAFPKHETFARRMTALLGSEDVSASVEVLVRRWYFGGAEKPKEGFYFSVYVSGYANNAATARKRWAVALRLVETAIVQLSADAGSAQRDSL